LGLRHRGFDTAHFAHANRAAGLFNDAAMKIENLAECEVSHQLNRR
jgi:hypothetical protein